MFDNFNNPVVSNNNRDYDAQARTVARLIKLGAIAVGSLLFLIFFFNYIASVTRIGAGYVGVEVVLSGSQRGASEIPIRTGWVFTARSARRSSSSLPSCRP